MTREKELQRECAKYGTVQSCKLLTDPFTEDSRCFAFVTMSSAQEAKDVIKQLNGYEFDGSKITVELAKRAGPRARTPGKYQGKPYHRTPLSESRPKPRGAPSYMPPPFYPPRYRDFEDPFVMDRRAYPPSRRSYEDRAPKPLDYEIDSYRRDRYSREKEYYPRDIDYERVRDREREYLPPPYRERDYRDRDYGPYSRDYPDPYERSSHYYESRSIDYPPPRPSLRKYRNQRDDDRFY
uniref:RRM domain-containing protein n=1 Tax=Arcella intermedia TaxID=1963864 RepID=A0A6B2LD38_9EUKA